MRLSRIKVKNLANFSDLDVETGDSIVLVGENKVGNSNFVRVLQLILDPGCPNAIGSLGLNISGTDHRRISLGRMSSSLSS